MAWIETVVNGLLLGGLYGLIGIGLALVFGVMRVVDGAQGEFMVMAAFFAVIVLAAAPDLHPLIIFGLAILFSFCIGYVYQSWIVNRSMQSADPLAPLLLTFGVSIILRSVMVEVFGADLRGLQLGSLSRASIAIFNINIGVMPLLTLATSIVLFLLLQWMLKRTSFGRQRGQEQHPIGRDVQRLSCEEQSVSTGRHENLMAERDKTRIAREQVPHLRHRENEQSLCPQAQRAVAEHEGCTGAEQDRRDDTGYQTEMHRQLRLATSPDGRIRIMMKNSK